MRDPLPWFPRSDAADFLAVQVCDEAVAGLDRKEDLAEALELRKISRTRSKVSRAARETQSA